MRDLLPCPPCGRQGRPGQGFLAGSNTSEPRGSAPRERDHRGGDHPVPSRTRQLSPPSPRVLQRKAAGGQGVALAEGAFLHARARRMRRTRRTRREGPQGDRPCGPFRVLGRSRLRWRPDRRCGAYGPRPASWGEQVPQGDRPLWVFLYSEAVRCRRICARTSCWTGPVHGMCRRICVGSLRAF